MRIAVVKLVPLQPAQRSAEEAMRASVCSEYRKWIAANKTTASTDEIGAEMAKFLVECSLCI